MTYDGGWRPLAVVVAVTVAVDQASKAVAWRTIDGAVINPGSGVVAPWLDVTLASSLTGALLDLVGVLVLTTAAVLTVRRIHDRLLWWAAALSIAGWTSNLLDRLGAHWLTAPGSRRGTVDWLQGHNLADLVIWTGAALAVAWLAREVVREVGWDLRRPHHRAVAALVVGAIAVSLLAGMASMDGRIRPPAARAPSGTDPSSAATGRCDDPAYALSPENALLCADDPSAARAATLGSAVTCPAADRTAVVQVRIANPNRDRAVRYAFAARGDVVPLPGSAPRGQVDPSGSVRTRFRLRPGSAAALHLETATEVWDGTGHGWIATSGRLWTAAACASAAEDEDEPAVRLLCEPTGTARVLLSAGAPAYREDRRPVTVSWTGSLAVTTDPRASEPHSPGFTLDLTDRLLTVLRVVPTATSDTLRLDGQGPLPYDGSSADAVTLPVGRCLASPWPRGPR